MQHDLSFCYWSSNNEYSLLQAPSWKGGLSRSRDLAIFFCRKNLNVGARYLIQVSLTLKAQYCRLRLPQGCLVILRQEIRLRKSCSQGHIHLELDSKHLSPRITRSSGRHSLSKPSFIVIFSLPTVETKKSPWTSSSACSRLWLGTTTQSLV